MIKTALKHKLAEWAIEAFFKGVHRNFCQPDMTQLYTDMEGVVYYDEDVALYIYECDDGHNYYYDEDRSMWVEEGGTLSFIDDALYELAQALEDFDIDEISNGELIDFLNDRISTGGFS